MCKNMGPYGSSKADKTSRVVGTLVFVTFAIIIKVIMQ